MALSSFFLPSDTPDESQGFFVLNSRLYNALPFVLLLLSGGATLGWQFLWTEQLGLKLGHESISLLAVTTAFFGGSSFGSWLADRPFVRRITPGKVYVVCEAVIAVWGVILGSTLSKFCEWAMILVGANPTMLWQGSITFFASLLVLAPSTIAMGATLPLVNSQIKAGRSTWAGLYSANTVGAVIGVSLVIFFATPQLGFHKTSNLLILCNIVCACLATWAWIFLSPAVVGSRPAPTLLSSKNVVLTLAVSGFLGVGFEIIASRILAGITENTIFSYAATLIIYLFATSVGAAWYQKSISNRKNEFSQLGKLLLYLLVATLMSCVCLWYIDRISAAIVERYWPFTGAPLFREFVAAALVIFAPAAVMGATFSHLCDMAYNRGTSYAISLAANALGATFAPVLLCAVLVPIVGLKSVLVVLILGYGFLWIAWTQRQRLATLAVAALAGLAIYSPPLRFIDLPVGGKLLSYQDGVLATVSVTEDAAGVARLQINNRVQEGSSASGILEARLAQIPLALHPSPKNALFLGVGTGFTSQIAAMEPALSVTAVELVPEVLEAIPFFARSANRKNAAKAVNYVSGDARRYIQASPKTFDVIVGDLFHPARNGAGSLYTLEQFAGVKKRLTSQGVYCQWLALHQMDNDTLRSIVGSFVQVYPNAVAVLANNSIDTPVIGLIGRGDDSGFFIRDIQVRLNSMNDSHLLSRSELRDTNSVLGVMVADSESLRHFAQSVPANTDDKPIVNHMAPWTTYLAASLPKQRLSELLNVLWIKPEAVIQELGSEDAKTYVAYWQARSAYLKLGMEISAMNDPQKILDQVQGRLLQILRNCPTYSPARTTLLQLANAVQLSDPSRAQALQASLNSIK